MIAYLCGEIQELGEDFLVLDVNGVGYEVRVTGRTCEALSGTKGPVKIYTYMQVKEDGISLFGFLTRDDLSVFRLLIGVNGIGPKGALGILTALSADDLRFAVACADAKAISRAPGIGMKTAQRVILDLKDRMKLSDTTETFADGDGEAAAPVSGAPGAARSEAIQALVALGYSNTDAVLAVKKAGDTAGMDTEAILKVALKQMAFM